MFSVLIYCRTAWEDHFPSTSTTTLTSQTYTSRQTPSNTSVYVSDCLFKFITSSSDGGALYCYNSVTYFLVESTSFFSCKTSSGSGGAIYFYHSSGQSVLYKVCGCDCCTGSGYSCQFAYIQVKYASSSKNYVNYSSIVRCVNKNVNTYSPFRLWYGNICCPSVNSSLNKCYQCSGIYCYPYCDSNNVTCSLIYSSFVDNNATEYICILLYRSYAKYEIKSCNILRNTQSNLDSCGTIYTDGNLNIYDSCILENTANNIFYRYYSGTITLTSCTVDKTSNNGYLTTRNTVRKSFIHALNHMSNLVCHSEYDSFVYLTPITPRTPSPTRQMW